jgi:hypothetical protein
MRSAVQMPGALGIALFGTGSALTNSPRRSAMKRALSVAVPLAVTAFVGLALVAWARPYGLSS